MQQLVTQSGSSTNKQPACVILGIIWDAQKAFIFNLSLHSVVYTSHFVFAFFFMYDVCQL